MHAHENKKRWPESLEVLVAEGSVTAEQLAPPFPESADRQYVYRAPANPSDKSEVVIGDPHLRDGGANFGFVDGRVEWITGSRAEELLSRLQGR
jgi:prepilin-type processing-associated H-X9-DG protein